MKEINLTSCKHEPKVKAFSTVSPDGEEYNVMACKNCREEATRMMREQSPVAVSVGYSVDSTPKSVKLERYHHEKKV